VLNAHNARVAAVEKRDFATYSRLVADDCINTDDDGIVDTNPNAHVLEHWKPIGGTDRKSTRRSSSEGRSIPRL
jgi:hypothetical protein